VLIGVMGGVKSEINLAQLMVRRQKICGSVLRPRPVEEKARIIQHFYQQALPHFLNGNLSPIVDQIFLLEDVRKAHELMDASGHFGKIVLQVDPSISVV
jgi:NADPH:quinone reductase-like Zn-dependent oxidoreductase